MQKGFFISLDLIICVVAVFFLFGILGAYLHSGIQDFATYKDDAKMQSTMNIVLNRLASSEHSCDMVDDLGFSIKKVNFCIQLNTNLSNLINDLDYNVYIGCYYYLKNVVVSCFQIPSFVPLNSEKYIAKDIFLLVPSKTLSKQKYFECTEGNYDINTLVRVYVWN